MRFWDSAKFSSLGVDSRLLLSRPDFGPGNFDNDRRLLGVDIPPPLAILDKSEGTLGAFLGVPLKSTRFSVPKENIFCCISLKAGQFIEISLLSISYIDKHADGQESSYLYNYSSRSIGISKFMQWNISHDQLDKMDKGCCL